MKREWDDKIAELFLRGRVRDTFDKPKLAREWNTGNCEPVKLNVAEGGVVVQPTRAASSSLAALSTSSAAPIPKTAPGKPVTSLASLPVAKKPSKFRNVKTNGYASTREANRAAELKLLEASGEILGLREQVPFILIPEQDGERPCKYLADFTYTTKRGEYVVEDTKGVKTAEYIVKRKLMLHVHGIRIRET